MWRKQDNAMAFIPTLDCAEVAIRGLLLSKPVANILHFQYVTEPSSDDLQDLADVVDDWMGDTWLPDVSTGYEYIGTEAKSLISATAPFALAATNAGFGGKTGEPSQPNNVSFAIKFTTGVTGRSNRGRYYVAGITEGDEDPPNYIALTRVTPWVANLAALQAAALAIEFTLAILSKVSGGVVSNPHVLVPVTAIGFTDLRIDTMRRRLPKS